MSALTNPVCRLNGFGTRRAGDSPTTASCDSHERWNGPSSNRMHRASNRGDVKRIGGGQSAMPTPVRRPSAYVIEPQAEDGVTSPFSSPITSRRRAGARYAGLRETIGRSGYWPILQRPRRRWMVMKSAKPADSGELGHRFRCERYGRSCLRRHRLEVFGHKVRRLRRRGSHDLLRPRCTFVCFSVPSVSTRRVRQRRFQGRRCSVSCRPGPPGPPGPPWFSQPTCR